MKRRSILRKKNQRGGSPEPRPAESHVDSPIVKSPVFTPVVRAGEEGKPPPPPGRPMMNPASRSEKPPAPVGTPTRPQPLITYDQFIASFEKEEDKIGWTPELWAYILDVYARTGKKYLTVQELKNYKGEDLLQAAAEKKKAAGAVVVIDSGVVEEREPYKGLREDTYSTTEGLVEYLASSPDFNGIDNLNQRFKELFIVLKAYNAPISFTTLLAQQIYESGGSGNALNQGLLQNEEVLRNSLFIAGCYAYMYLKTGALTWRRKTIQLVNKLDHLDTVKRKALIDLFAVPQAVPPPISK